MLIIGLELMNETKGQPSNGDGAAPPRAESSPRIHLVNQADEIERIFRKAVRHELSIHKRLGNPIATWKDGKVVIIPPEEIPVDDPG